MRLRSSRRGDFKGDYSPLLDRYAQYLTLELGRAPRTGDGYQKTIQTVARWAGKPFWEVVSDDLRAFKREAPYAPTTKQHAVVAYHSLHKWALLEEVEVLTRHSPKILAVVTPSVVALPKAPIELHDARRLLEICSRPLEYRVVYLPLYAGTRIKEAATIGHKEWRRDRLIFVGKGSKQRTVPVHPELDRVKHDILSTTPKSEGVLQSVFARLRDALDLKDTAGESATTHSLRRTFADFMYDRADVPQEVVGQVLGHGKKVTELYAPVRFEKMQNGVFSVDYYSGQPVQLRLFGEPS